MGRYEKIVLDANNGFGRLSYTSEAFSVNSVPDLDPTKYEIPPVEKIGGSVGNFLNKQIGKVNEKVTNLVNKFNAAEGAKIFVKSNPNKYFSLVSASPVSITDGVPDFTANPLIDPINDVQKATGKLGGTFNPSTHIDNQSVDIKNHFTLPYEALKMASSYEGGEDFDPNLTSMKTKLEGFDATSKYLEGIRNKYHTILKNSGEATKGAGTVKGANGIFNEEFGVVKGGIATPNVDRVNILPIVDGGQLSTGNIPKSITDNPDFIKFRFRDVINNKYLVFRALLSGITDTVTPEYSPHEYIGRPDKLYTYKGVDREVSFSFKVYPKTKQELPVLVEKMNYLVGMCYPSYTDNERMIAPFIELTLGDMFVDAPGLLNGVTVTVEDNTTWEIENGLQFPKHVSVQSTFKYIGKYAPVSLGKFYDISWLSDNRKGDNLSGKPIGTYVVDPILKQPATVPSRKNGEKEDFTWINTITGNKLTDGIIQEEA